MYLFKYQTIYPLHVPGQRRTTAYTLRSIRYGTVTGCCLLGGGGHGIRRGHLTARTSGTDLVNDGKGDGLATDELLNHARIITVRALRGSVSGIRECFRRCFLSHTHTHTHAHTYAQTCTRARAHNTHTDTDYTNKRMHPSTHTHTHTRGHTE